MHAPPFRESISWIFSPFKFWRATIFLHAHLQVVYYKYAKFHKNPISGLVALTRYMDGRTDGQGDSYIPPQTLFAGGINIRKAYITPYYWWRPSSIKLVQLLSAHNVKELNNLGKYLCLAEKVRNNAHVISHFLCRLSYVCFIMYTVLFISLIYVFHWCFIYACSCVS